MRETSDSALPRSVLGYAVGGRARRAGPGPAPKVCAPEIASRTAWPIRPLPFHACWRASRRRPSSSVPATSARSTSSTTKAGFGAEERGRHLVAHRGALQRRGAGQLAEEPVEPAVALGRAGGRVLDGLHRGEVRAVRGRHAGGVHRRERAGVPHRQQRRERRVQAEHRVGRQQRRVGYADARARGVVGGVAVRHDEREAVGGAAQRQQDEHRAERGGQPVRGAAGDGVRPRAGAAEAGAEGERTAGEGGAAEEGTPAQREACLVVVGAAAGAGAWGYVGWSCQHARWSGESRTAASRRGKPHW